jgi:plastocyanin
MKKIILLLLILLLMGCAKEAQEIAEPEVLETVEELKEIIETTPVEEPKEVPSEKPTTEIDIVEESKLTTNEINIHRDKFDPDTITIKVGDTVTWTNKDDRKHFIVGKELTQSHIEVVNEGWKSKTLAPGETYSYKFQVKGKFGYVNGFFGTGGNIIVE